MKSLPSQEKIDWILEFVTLFTVVATLLLIDANWGVSDAKLSVLLPMLSSVLIGSSLGIYRRLALAEQRPSPRFPTAFIFYVTFALVLLTPLLKYPLLAGQINDLAGYTNMAKREQESVYYSSRGIPIAFFVILGIVTSIVAFTLCNALQHPAIRQSQVNLFVSCMPILICIAIEPKKFGASLGTEG